MSNIEKAQVLSSENHEFSGFDFIVAGYLYDHTHTTVPNI